MSPFKHASRVIIGSVTVMAVLLMAALVQVVALSGLLDFSGPLTF
jgi:hypothetical protein